MSRVLEKCGLLFTGKLHMNKSLSSLAHVEKSMGCRGEETLPLSISLVLDKETIDQDFWLSNDKTCSGHTLLRKLPILF